MKVSVLTLGCKANQAESAIIEADLQSRGCNIVDLHDTPDFCVINTCAVTSKSDYESRRFIRRAHKAGSSVIVTGCYAQLNREKVKAMESVTLVVDNRDKSSIGQVVTGNTSCLTSSSCLPGRSRYLLKVQDGCNHACSYCIIPNARGRSRSIPIETVIQQIGSISDSYGEVVLTGIHLGTYGYDLLPKVSLSLLIETILSRTKIKRIRLSSLEVREVDDQLIELIQEARVCKHLHIPLQSGDDRILMKMRRTYNSREFIDRINYLLSRVSGIAIGTDIIVGFPGESNEEFENTRAIVESIPFSYLHVFPFSARKGTEASKMPSGLDPETKRRRCLELRGLGSKKKMTYMKNQIGKTLDMLVEERDSSGACLGTTGNYLKVRAFVESACVKDIVPVRIARADELTLEGLPISKI